MRETQPRESKRESINTNSLYDLRRVNNLSALCVSRREGGVRVYARGGGYVDGPWDWEMERIDRTANGPDVQNLQRRKCLSFPEDDSLEELGLTRRGEPLRENLVADVKPSIRELLRDVTVADLSSDFLDRGAGLLELGVGVVEKSIRVEAMPTLRIPASRLVLAILVVNDWAPWQSRFEEAPTSVLTTRSVGVNCERLRFTPPVKVKSREV